MAALKITKKDDFDLGIRLTHSTIAGGLSTALRCRLSKSFRHARSGS
jgi:hypothetical protein